MRPHTAAARRRGIHYDVLELLLRLSELLWSPTATVRTSSHYKGVPMHAHYAVSRGHDHHELEHQLRSSGEVWRRRGGEGRQDRGARGWTAGLLAGLAQVGDVQHGDPGAGAGGGRARAGRPLHHGGGRAGGHARPAARLPRPAGRRARPQPARPAGPRFTEKLDAVLRGEFPVTIILDDPAGNSYAQSLADDPEEPDDGLKITFYERTFEQNEELGLNDMQTENYKTDEHEQHDASDKSEQHEQSDKSDQPDR